MKVIRTRQCAKCPWRKDSDPYTIPGYSLDQHEALAGTIARDLTTTQALWAWLCRAQKDLSNDEKTYLPVLSLP